MPKCSPPVAAGSGYILCLNSYYKINVYEFKVGMTLEDYIVLADIPKIQLDPEEEPPGLRWRSQSPSPIREQRLRSYRWVVSCTV